MTVTEPADRPKATELAGRADGRGLLCHRCGCRHFFKVASTRPEDDFIMRYRVCRNCGAKRQTFET